MLSGRRREMAVALVIVAALAGCTGAWGGGASPEPVGTPTDAPTATGGPPTTAAGPSATTSGTTASPSTTTTASATASTTAPTTAATTPAPSTTPSTTATTAPTTITETTTATTAPTTTESAPTTTETAPTTTGTAPTTTGTAPTTTATTTSTAATTAPQTTTRSTTTDGTGGTVGGAELFDDHAAAVRSAGSYAAEFAVATRQLDGGDAVSAEGTLEAEFEPDARLQSLRHRSGDRERTEARYLPSGSETVAMCLEPDGGECADRRQRSQDDAPSLAPFDLTTPTATATLGAATATYADEGLVSTDDGERRRYVVDDPADLGEYQEDVTVREAAVVVDVDPDTSRITAFEYDVTIEDADGNRYRLAHAVEYTQFGGVDVAEPAWYEG